MDLEFGVAFSKDKGFHEFGVDAVNAAIAAGRRIASIATKIKCDKIGEKDGMMSLTFTGAICVATFEALAATGEGE